MITKVGEYWRKSWDVYDCCPFTDSYISVGLVVKNPPASARDAGDVGLIPGSGRSSGGGNSTHSSILGGFHGQKSLAGHSPWGREELDMTEHTHTYLFKVN